MTLAASRLATAIGRAVFALLLMLAAVTPAFAELGCFEDQIEHAGAPGASAFQNVIADDQSGDEDQNGPVGKPMHCAFSHCSHSIASNPPQRGASNHDSSRISYAPQLTLPLAAAPRDGPDYPPRA